MIKESFRVDSQRDPTKKVVMMRQFQIAGREYNALESGQKAVNIKERNE